MIMKIDQALFYTRPDADNSILRLTLESPTPQGHEAMCCMTTEEHQRVRELMALAFSEIGGIVIQAALRAKNERG